MIYSFWEKRTYVCKKNIVGKVGEKVIYMKIACWNIWFLKQFWIKSMFTQWHRLYGKMSYNFFAVWPFHTRAILSASNCSFAEGTMSGSYRSSYVMWITELDCITHWAAAIGRLSQSVWFGPTALWLSYGRYCMSSRMKANTTLYILLLDATWIVRTLYDRCHCVWMSPNCESLVGGLRI